MTLQPGPTREPDATTTPTPSDEIDVTTFTTEPPEKQVRSLNPPIGDVLTSPPNFLTMLIAPTMACRS